MDSVSHPKSTQVFVYRDVPAHPKSTQILLEHGLHIKVHIKPSAIWTSPHTQSPHTPFNIWTSFQSPPSYLVSFVPSPPDNSTKGEHATLSLMAQFPSRTRSVPSVRRALQGHKLTYCFKVLLAFVMPYVTRAFLDSV